MGREFLYNVGFKEYQFARIDSWLDPFHDTQGQSFQLAYALMAIGSGGMFGKGFNVSDVYVPVRESDMIFLCDRRELWVCRQCLCDFIIFHFDLPNDSGLF